MTIKSCNPILSSTISAVHHELHKKQRLAQKNAIYAATKEYLSISTQSNIDNDNTFNSNLYRYHYCMAIIFDDYFTGELEYRNATYYVVVKDEPYHLIYNDSGGKMNFRKLPKYTSDNIYHCIFDKKYKKEAEGEGDGDGDKSTLKITPEYNKLPSTDDMDEDSLVSGSIEATAKHTLHVVSIIDDVLRGRPIDIQDTQRAAKSAEDLAFIELTHIFSQQGESIENLISTNTQFAYDILSDSIFFNKKSKTPIQVRAYTLISDWCKPADTPDWTLLYFCRQKKISFHKTDEKAKEKYKLICEKRSTEKQKILKLVTGEPTESMKHDMDLIYDEVRESADIEDNLRKIVYYLYDHSHPKRLPEGMKDVENLNFLSILNKYDRYQTERISSFKETYLGALRVYVRINSSAPPGLIPPTMDGEAINEMTNYGQFVKELRGCTTIPTASIQYKKNDEDNSFVEQKSIFIENKVDDIVKLIGKQNAEGHEWDKCIKNTAYNKKIIGSCQPNTETTSVGPFQEVYETINRHIDAKDHNQDANAEMFWGNRCHMVKIDTTSAEGKDKVICEPLQINESANLFTNASFKADGTIQLTFAVPHSKDTLFTIEYITNENLNRLITDISLYKKPVVRSTYITTHVLDKIQASNDQFRFEHVGVFHPCPIFDQEKFQEMLPTKTSRHTKGKIPHTNRVPHEHDACGYLTRGHFRVIKKTKNATPTTYYYAFQIRPSNHYDDLNYPDPDPPGVNFKNILTNTQSLVGYNETFNLGMKDLVDNLVAKKPSGFTLFGYGYSGTGKSFTLFGEPNKGVFDKLMDMFEWYQKAIDAFDIAPDGVTSKTVASSLQASFLTQEGIPLPIGYEEEEYNPYLGIKTAKEVVQAYSSDSSHDIHYGFYKKDSNGSDSGSNPGPNTDHAEPLTDGSPPKLPTDYIDRQNSINKLKTEIKTMMTNVMNLLFMIKHMDPYDVWSKYEPDSKFMLGFIDDSSMTTDDDTTIIDALLSSNESSFDDIFQPKLLKYNTHKRKHSDHNNCCTNAGCPVRKINQTKQFYVLQLIFSTEGFIPPYDMIARAPLITCEAIQNKWNTTIKTPLLNKAKTKIPNLNIDDNKQYLYQNVYTVDDETAKQLMILPDQDQEKNPFQTIVMKYLQNFINIFRATNTTLNILDNTELLSFTPEELTILNSMSGKLNLAYDEILKLLQTYQNHIQKLDIAMLCATTRTPKLFIKLSGLKGDIPVLLNGKIDDNLLPQFSPKMLTMIYNHIRADIPTIRAFKDGCQKKDNNCLSVLNEFITRYSYSKLFEKAKEHFTIHKTECNLILRTLMTTMGKIKYELDTTHYPIYKKPKWNLDISNTVNIAFVGLAEKLRKIQNDRYIQYDDQKNEGPKINRSDIFKVKPQLTQTSDNKKKKKIIIPKYFDKNTNTVIELTLTGNVFQALTDSEDSIIPGILFVGLLHNLIKLARQKLKTPTIEQTLQNIGNDMSLNDNVMHSKRNATLNELDTLSKMKNIVQLDTLDEITSKKIKSLTHGDLVRPEDIVFYIKKKDNTSPDNGRFYIHKNKYTTDVNLNYEITAHVPPEVQDGDISLVRKALDWYEIEVKDINYEDIKDEKGWNMIDTAHLNIEECDKSDITTIGNSSKLKRWPVSPSGEILGDDLTSTSRNIIPTNNLIAILLCETGIDPKFLGSTFNNVIKNKRRFDACNKQFTRPSYHDVEEVDKLFMELKNPLLARFAKDFSSLKSYIIQNKYSWMYTFSTILLSQSSMDKPTLKTLVQWKWMIKSIKDLTFKGKDNVDLLPDVKSQLETFFRNYYNYLLDKLLDIESELRSYENCITQYTTWSKADVAAQKRDADHSSNLQSLENQYIQDQIKAQNTTMRIFEDESKGTYKSAKESYNFADVMQTNVYDKKNKSHEQYANRTDEALESLKQNTTTLIQKEINANNQIVKTQYKDHQEEPVQNFVDCYTANSMINSSQKQSARTQGFIQMAIKYLLTTEYNRATIQIKMESVFDLYGEITQIGEKTGSDTPGCKHRILQYTPFDKTADSDAFKHCFNVETRPNKSTSIYSDFFENEPELTVEEGMTGEEGIEKIELDPTTKETYKNGFTKPADIDIFSKIMAQIETARIRTGMVKSTPNNIRSSRGHLFMIFKITKTTDTGKASSKYMTIIDMAGIENPWDISQKVGYKNMVPAGKAGEILMDLNGLGNSNQYTKKTDEEQPSWSLYNDETFLQKKGRIESDSTVKYFQEYENFFGANSIRKNYPINEDAQPYSYLELLTLGYAYDDTISEGRLIMPPQLQSNTVKQILTQHDSLLKSKYVDGGANVDVPRYKKEYDLCAFDREIKDTQTFFKYYQFNHYSYSEEPILVDTIRTTFFNDGESHNHQFIEGMTYLQNAKQESIQPAEFQRWYLAFRQRQLLDKLEEPDFKPFGNLACSFTSQYSAIFTVKNNLIETTATVGDDSSGDDSKTIQICNILDTNSKDISNDIQRIYNNLDRTTYRIMKEGFYINQTIIDLVQYFKFNKIYKDRKKCLKKDDKDDKERVPGFLNVKTFCEGLHEVKYTGIVIEEADMKILAGNELRIQLDMLAHDHITDDTNYLLFKPVHKPTSIKLIFKVNISSDGYQPEFMPALSYQRVDISEIRVQGICKKDDPNDTDNIQMVRLTFKIQYNDDDDQKKGYLPLSYFTADSNTRAANEVATATKDGRKLIPVRSELDLMYINKQICSQGFTDDLVCTSGKVKITLKEMSPQITKGSVAPQLLTTTNYKDYFFNNVTDAPLDKTKSLVNLENEFIDLDTQDVEINPDMFIKEYKQKILDTLSETFNNETMNSIRNEIKPYITSYINKNTITYVSPEFGEKFSTCIADYITQYKYFIRSCQNIKNPETTGLISIMDYLKYYKNEGLNKYVMMCLTHPRLKNAYCEGVCKGLEFAQEVAASATTDAGVWICDQALLATGVNNDKYKPIIAPPIAPHIAPSMGGYKRHHQIYTQKRLKKAVQNYSQKKCK